MFIQQALDESLTLDEFIERLSAKDVSVRLKQSDEGEIEGISYGLNGVAFQGRQLGKDYSWSHLEVAFVRKMTHQTEIVGNVLDEDSEEGIVVEPKVTLVPDHTQKEQNDELEQQKTQLRDKYVNFATHVRNMPQFRNRENKDIDIGVTLLSLKAGDTLQEAKMILTQSDTLRQRHQEFSRDDFLKVAKPYIQQIASQAVELFQKHSLKENFR